jgi:hypothetical protein
MADRKKVTQNTDKRTHCSCLGEKDAKRTLLDVFGTTNWRLKFLNDKLLNVIKEAEYRKVLRLLDNDQVRNLGRYLDTVKCLIV